MATWVKTGNILGPEGPAGEEGPQGLQGVKGDNGAAGRAIDTVEINSDGDLLLTFSDLPDSPNNLGHIVGAPGTPASNNSIDAHLGGDATDLVTKVIDNSNDIVWIAAALPTKADLNSPAFTGTVTGISKAAVGLGNVDNTSDVAKPVSTAQATADTAVATAASADATAKANAVGATSTAALALKAPLASPAFTGTPTGITKTHVGLANVDNTSDANKPISTADAAALALKAPLASPAFTGTPTGITKTHVGLGSVDNTSDIAKPVSTAQATADTAVATAASADATTKASAAQAAAIAAAATDATTKDNAALAVSTTALALKAPLASPAFTGTPTGITKVHVGLFNVDNTTDLLKPISTAQAAVNTTLTLATATVDGGTF